MRSRRRGGAGRPPWPVSSVVVLLLREVSRGLRGGEGGSQLRHGHRPGEKLVEGGAGPRTPRGVEGMRSSEPGGSGKKDGMGMEGCWAEEDRAQEAVR